MITVKNMLKKKRNQTGGNTFADLGCFILINLCFDESCM